MDVDDITAAIAAGDLDGQLEPIVAAAVSRVREGAVEMRWRIRFDGDDASAPVGADTAPFERLQEVRMSLRMTCLRRGHGCLRVLHREPPRGLPSRHTAVRTVEHAVYRRLEGQRSIS